MRFRSRQRPFSGVLFTIPSRYLSAIGHQVIFRLSGWSRQIHTGFLGPRATREYAHGVHAISPTGLPPTTARHSKRFDYHADFSLHTQTAAWIKTHPTTPNTQHLPAITCARFSLIRFRSPLLTESQLFSLPVGTEMFHFPTSPPHTL